MPPLRGDAFVHVEFEHLTSKGHEVDVTVPVLIVPGLGGSGEEHWQTHLERSFPGAARVQQDDWDRPDLPKWMDRLARAVAERPGAILVAHSLGCPLVVHLAVQEPNLPVAAALLVAPADVESARHTPDHTRGFAPIPRLRLPFRCGVVASTNDPFIELERAWTLAQTWGAEFINVGACGHINVASGYGPWPVGERIVAAMIVGARPSLGLPGPGLTAPRSSDEAARAAHDFTFLQGRHG